MLEIKAPGRSKIPETGKYFFFSIVSLFKFYWGGNNEKKINIFQFGPSRNLNF